MFSASEKKKIAKAVEDVIREINHPEMDNDNIRFTLHVDGREDWSFADIRENRKGDPDKDKNPWNEISRDHLYVSGKTFKEIFEVVMADPKQLPKVPADRYPFIALLLDKTLKREVGLSDFGKILSYLDLEERSALGQFLTRSQDTLTEQCGEGFYKDLAELVGFRV